MEKSDLTQKVLEYFTSKHLLGIDLKKEIYEFSKTLTIEDLKPIAFSLSEPATMLDFFTSHGVNINKSSEEKIKKIDDYMIKNSINFYPTALKEVQKYSPGFIANIMEKNSELFKNQYLSEATFLFICINNKGNIKLENFDDEKKKFISDSYSLIEKINNGTADKSAITFYKELTKSPNNRKILADYALSVLKQFTTTLYEIKSEIMDNIVSDSIKDFKKP